MEEGGPQQVAGGGERVPFGRTVFVFAEGEGIPDVPENKMLKFVQIKDDMGERVLAGSATTFDHWQVTASDPAFRGKAREEICVTDFEDAGLLIRRDGEWFVTAGSGDLKVGGKPSARMTEKQQAERHEERAVPFLSKVVGERVRVL